MAADAGKNKVLRIGIIKDGKIVPVSITCALLRNAMKAAGWESKKFLIDGFPRNQDNDQGW